MIEIIAATGNEGKVKEIKEILKDFKVLSYKDLGEQIEVDEDAETFEGNALKKAKAGAEHFNKMCLADDSGIMIDYLDGFPGVRTVRWMEGTDRERNMAILEKMKGVPKEKRKIHYITAIALATPDKSIVNSFTLDGYVAEEPRGENGFGFDEIFELEDGRTLSEITQEEKNEISSRRKALEITKKKIAEF
jgi:XTP/dITP diphosphohydrolase